MYRQSALFTSASPLLMPIVFQEAFSHNIDFFGSSFLNFSITLSLLLPSQPADNIIKKSFFAGLVYGSTLGFTLYNPVFQNPDPEVVQKNYMMAETCENYFDNKKKLDL